MMFFVGLHFPHHAKHFARACISIKQLRRRQKPLGATEIIIDSGAFSEISLHGEFKTPVEQYASELARLAGIANIAIAVAQDFMCEPPMLLRTGLSIAEHQRRTIERYDALLAHSPVRIMPVLQGWSPDDYRRHLAGYGDRLTFGQWVGVGTLCKRNGAPERIVDILCAIRRERPDLRLHGFGIKATALRHPAVRELLYSADSMAWSFAARKQGRDSNDWREAHAFAERVQQIAALPMTAWQIPLPLERA
jgi:hypothetical protein